MYRVWYWAMIDRENDGRFIASIPDLRDLAAYGDTDKNAVAHVTDLAAERARAAVNDGQPVPPRRQCSEMPSYVRSKSSIPLGQRPSSTCSRLRLSQRRWSRKLPAPGKGRKSDKAR
jgi:predicted RNase H-like HicB family nuclease